MESALREFGSAPGLRLIETMLWDGAAFPRLPLHLARLSRGAAALGWPTPQVTGPLAALRPAEPARVRLTYGAQGQIDLGLAAMPERALVWISRRKPRSTTSNSCSAPRPTKPV